MRTFAARWLIFLVMILTAGLLSSCMPIPPYGMTAYTLTALNLEVGSDTPAVYSVHLAAGQKVTVTVQSQGIMRAKIDLIGPDQQVIASQSMASSSGPNGAVSFPPMLVEIPGTYQLVATSENGFYGSLSVGLNINTASEIEPNNTRDTAQDLTSSLVTLPGNARHFNVHNGSISQLTDVDYYRLPLQAGQTVAVQAKRVDTDPPSLRVTLETASGEVIPSAPVITVPSDGLYYLKVEIDPNSRTTIYNPWGYYLLVRVDSDIDQEPNDSPATAQSLLLGRPMLGYIGIVRDFYGDNLPTFFSNNNNNDFILWFGTDGALDLASLRNERGYYRNFFSEGDVTRFVLHANQTDIDGSAMGFQKIDRKRIAENKRFSSFTGQANGIQVERAVVLSETQDYAYLITSLTNLTDVDIPDVSLLDSLNPSPGGDTNITGGWEAIGGMPAGILIAGNETGYMGLFSPDADIALRLAESDPDSPTQVIGSPHFEPAQPGNYSLNVAADLGTLPANSIKTTTTILILADSVEQVRALAMDALAQQPIFDDFYRIHHKIGIFKASLYTPQYGYSEFYQGEERDLPELNNSLEPVLALFNADGSPLGASGELVDNRVELTYSIETEGNYTLQTAPRYPWGQYGGEYVLRVDPLLQIDQSPEPQAVCAGQPAEFITAYSGDWVLQIQWQVREPGAVDWSDLPGETNTRLTFPAQLAQQGNQYRAILSAGTDHLTSEAAALTIQDRPVITQHPQDLVLRQNQRANLQASAGGQPNPVFQWRYSPDGGQTWVDLPGETGSELHMVGDTTQNGWLFRAAASNTCGASLSRSARLTVLNATYLPMLAQP